MVGILLNICLVFLCFLFVNLSAILLTIILFKICLFFLCFLCQFSVISFQRPLLVLPPSRSFIPLPIYLYLFCIFSYEYRLALIFICCLFSSSSFCHSSQFSPILSSCNNYPQLAPIKKYSRICLSTVLTSSVCLYPNVFLCSFLLLSLFELVSCTLEMKIKHLRTVR